MALLAAQFWIFYYFIENVLIDIDHLDAAVAETL